MNISYMCDFSFNMHVILSNAQATLSHVNATCDHLHMKSIKQGCVLQIFHPQFELKDFSFMTHEQFQRSLVSEKFYPDRSDQSYLLSKEFWKLGEHH